MPELWTPGATGRSLEDFVERIHRKIEGFTQQRGLERASVEVVLHDGTRLSLYAISAEPGYGLITLCPYPQDEEQPWPGSDKGEACPPEELIVPVGSIMRITLSEPEQKRSKFGFAPPAASA